MNLPAGVGLDPVRFRFADRGCRPEVKVHRSSGFFAMLSREERSGGTAALPHDAPQSALI